MKEGTKDNYEKPDPQKLWTGGSKWMLFQLLSKYFV